MKSYKNKITNLILIGATIASTFSCGKKKQNNVEKVVQVNQKCNTLDLDQSPKMNEFKMSTIFSSVKVIPLQITDNSMIGNITGLQVIDDKIIILDKIIANSMFVFDMGGNFLFRVGRKGQGPGEYSEISDFTIDYDKKLIFLLDYYRQIINVYRLKDGYFLYSINIFDNNTESYNIQYVDGLCYLDMFYRKNRNNNKKYMLRSVNIKTGRTIELYMDADKYNKGYNNIGYAGNRVFFTRNKEPIYMQSFMDTLMVLKNKGPEAYIVLNSNKLVNEKDMKEAIQSKENSYVNSFFFTKNKFHTLENFIESDDFILIKFYYGNRLQFLYFDKKGKRSTIHNILFDDVLFKNFDVKTNRIMANFLYNDYRGVYAYIPSEHIPYLIDAFKKKELNISQSDYKIFSRINEESNPIVLLYESK